MYRSARHPLPRLLSIVLLTLAVPAAAQTFNYFPGDAADDDGRTVALAGEDIETLSQDFMSFLLIVPPGETRFELAIFDGETGLADSAGHRHWDNGSTELQYALYHDPFRTSNTDPAKLVGVWHGNQTNASSGPGWSADSATFPDNGWWNLVVDVPEPPEPAPGLAPSGASYYHLCVSYRAATGGVAADPCTGDPRPADASRQTISNFKLRATANISVLSFAFAYEAALRFTNRDPFLIYPEWSGVAPPPGSTFWVDTPTTYDGRWSFEIHVPAAAEELVLYDGDFDFGTRAGGLAGFPSGLVSVECVDDNDPDTPDTADFPPFVLGPGGMRLDDSQPEGPRASGSPADDNSPDVFRRSPCIRWTLTSPLGTVYGNDNPSSQREWEQFRISSAADCDDSPACDPLVGNCADYCASGPLPSGAWRIDVEGVDLSNLNAWRSAYGFCTGSDCTHDPYLVGDTVFEDADGDGVQEPGEPGISGVVVELLDASGLVVDTRHTGDGSVGYEPGEWEACRERNTGGATPGGVPIDEAGLYCFDVAVPDTDPAATDTALYTVRIPGGEFASGGALHDHFGEPPTASRPSPEQTDQVVEAGGNVMTYDFGYFVTPKACGPCEGKVTRLTLRYDGTGPAYVKVKARRGPSKDWVFAGWVQGGETFEVVGPASGNGGFAGTLGTEIEIYVDGERHAMIHTSCSQPVGPGLVAGDFEVVSGESRHGGALCPVDGGGCDDCGGGEEPTGPGTGTIGYWKTHPEAWPVDGLRIAGTTYSKSSLLGMLEASAGGNKSLILAKQLIAAMLNVAAGNDASCIEDTIAAAQDWLGRYGFDVRGGHAWSQGEPLHDRLDDYNNGRLCAPHRG